MPRGPRKITVKTIRSDIASLQKKIDTRQDKIQKLRDEIKIIKTEMRKLERQANQLARNEFVEKIYAISVKHQIPIENVIETISLLNELKADPTQYDEKIKIIRDHFRTTNNAAGLKWIDAIERWLKQT